MTHVIIRQDGRAVSHSVRDTKAAAQTAAAHARIIYARCGQRATVEVGPCGGDCVGYREQLASAQAAYAGWGGVNG